MAYNHTASFYTEIKNVTWFNEQGVEFTPTPDQKLLHCIFGHFTRTEVVTKIDLFTVKYQRVAELNTLWLEKSAELGYDPQDVILKK